MNYLSALIRTARDAVTGNDRVVEATEKVRDMATTIANTITGTKKESPPIVIEYHGPDYFTRLPSQLIVLIFQYLAPLTFHSSLRISRLISSLHDHNETEILYKRHLFDADRCQNDRGGRGFREYLHSISEFHKLIPDDSDENIKYQIGTFRGHNPRMFVSMKKVACGWHDPNADNQYWQNETSNESVFNLMYKLMGVCWLQITGDISLPAPLIPNTVFRYRLWWRVGVNHRTTMHSPIVSIVPVENYAHLCSVTTEPREITDWMFRQLSSAPDSVVMGIGNDSINSERKNSDTDEKLANESNRAPGDLIEGEDEHEEKTAPPRNQAEALMRHTGMGRRAARLGHHRARPMQRRQQQPPAARPERVMRECLIGDVEVSGGLLHNEENPARVSSVLVSVRMLKCGPNEWWKNNIWFDGIIVERLNP